ncbi:MAG: 16S rRNA (guanine(966)-N(2))-methyltransferase RsmD [Anaerolineae bacterium]|nr:16S rRNA (guanine(966)-N(2))-methyltransferase RsmD [Anaerolineae bacterium]
MPLRVIAGSARGKKLKLVPGDSTRPIMDRVKEALFSILGSFVVRARFLDLFAGTGSVGIEALSRGAAFALFVEKSKAALETVRDNLRIVQLEAKAELRLADALELLRQTPSQAFDYIYMAPPQYQGLWREALLLLDANPSWLDNDGIVVVQIDPKEQEEVVLQHLRAYDERRYGATLLWFFEKIGNGEETEPS